MKADEFIREVEEELKQERLLELWKRWGNLVIGAALAIVVGTAAWVGWQRWQEAQRRAEAERFAAAERLFVEGRDREAVEALQAFARDASPGFATVARLLAAAAAERAGDGARAEDALRAVADDPAADPLLRDAALVQLLARRIEREDPRLLRARLEPLAVDGNPWRHAARFLLAATEVRAGQREAAVAALKRLIEEGTAPEGLRSRARELLEALGAEGQRATS
ncbi:MAG: tetratricopeptide repeat protein [Geminicoccaceae bacterium]|nr:tetratricopeptide repeat protein [Geminicoccaceae bacterium]MDW8341991.1 tetratricopeptide repeat protein [Geminicoccaceae bacterium]